MLKQVEKKLSKLALSLSLLASTPLWDRVGTQEVVLFRCLTVWNMVVLSGIPTQ